MKITWNEGGPMKLNGKPLTYELWEEITGIEGEVTYTKTTLYMTIFI